MLPSLIMGVLVFIFIMIMFQAIHYTEFVLIHGVSLLTVIQMLGFICISFLPALLPMSLLFSVLMTYGRLSQDSEIIALKATGHSMWSIITPAVMIAFFVALLSAQTSFHLAPWGNRQFEILISQLEQTKASATIREGTFSEGFFDLVIYANKVESDTNRLNKVFIYDERDAEVPLAVIAKEGQITQETKNLGRSVFLNLQNGDIHRQGENHTKINFSTFQIRLFDPAQENTRAKTSQSMSIEEISEGLKDKNLSEDKFRDLKVEYHKRWAISFACFVFALLGVGLGTTANTRHQKSNGLVISLIVFIAYWAIYVSAEGAARGGQLAAGPGIWLPNLIFICFAIFRLKKVWD
jgi:lipopolysaccharide export system permease protein